MRDNRQRWLRASLVGGAVVLLIALITWLLTTGGGPSPSGVPVVPPSTAPFPTATATPTTAAPSSSPSPLSAPTPSGNPFGTSDIAGFGNSSTPHTLLIEIVSRTPIYLKVGWKAPTSPGRSGTSSLHAAGWSRTMNVYGRPDFAAVYAQYAGGIGPVSCRIYVDGRLRVQYTATGYYGQVYCLG